MTYQPLAFIQQELQVERSVQVAAWGERLAHGATRRQPAPSASPSHGVFAVGGVEPSS